MIAQESKYKADMTSAGVHSDTLSPSSFIDEKKREKIEKIERDSREEERRTIEKRTRRQ